MLGHSVLKMVAVWTAVTWSLIVPDALRCCCVVGSMCSIGNQSLPLKPFHSCCAKPNPSDQIGVSNGRGRQRCLSPNCCQTFSNSTADDEGPNAKGLDAKGNSGPSDCDCQCCWQRSDSNANPDRGVELPTGVQTGHNDFDQIYPQIPRSQSLVLSRILPPPHNLRQAWLCVWRN